jgi:hypothetical protein
MESTIVARLIVSHEPLVLCWRESIITTKLRTIRINQDHMFTVPLGAHFVVSEGFVWVKVENKKKNSFFENYDFIIFVRLRNKLVS